MIPSALFSVLSDIGTPFSLDSSRSRISVARSALSAPVLRAHDKDPPLTSRYHVRSIPPGIRASAGFDSGRRDCGDLNGMGEPAAGEPVDLFLPANIARQFVGISVGIGRHPRQKLLQIQMVMELGGYRPGAPTAFAKASADKTSG